MAQLFADYGPVLSWAARQHVMGTTETTFYVLQCVRAVGIKRIATSVSLPTDLVGFICGFITFACLDASFSRNLSSLPQENCLKAPAASARDCQTRLP